MADLFTEVYNHLPLAHTINSRVIVMHGGLFSDDNVMLDDIRKVDRVRQPPESGKTSVDIIHLVLSPELPGISVTAPIRRSTHGRLLGKFSHSFPL